MPDLVTLPAFRAALANAGGAGSRTAAELPEDRLEAALDEAEAEVVGRLSQNFVVPTVPAEFPDLLAGIVYGIAGYVATLEYFGSQPVEDRDPVVLRYQRAQALLGQIAAGKVRLEELPEVTAGVVAGDAEIYNVGPAVNLTDQAPIGTAYGYHEGAPHMGGVLWG